MREYVVPPIALAPDERNITDDLYEIAAAAPDHVSLSRLVDGRWQPVTTGQFVDEVRRVAAGLIAAGIEPGDRVALMSATRYEWCVIESAIFVAGAVLVPIYDTSSAEQVWWILADSGAKAVFVESLDHAKTVAEVVPRLHDPITVWGIDAGDLGRVVDGGRAVSDDEVEARRRARGASDLAMIIYTSGTTGRPKGCQLVHGNFLDYTANLMPAGMDAVFDPAGSTLLFLPLAHSFAQVIQLGALQRQVRLGHTNMKTVPVDLASFQPHLILSVPRVFEKLYNTAKRKAHAEGHGRIFDQAETVAVAYSEALDTGGPSVMLRLKHAAFDRLVYSKIRAAMGGQVEWTISGGAPLGARLGHFFRGAGVNVLEGYGLTETTAGATVNLPNRQRVGSVGPPIPGMGIRIADDGEILLKGRLVFPGYWNNDDATKETFTDDGWFKTGDLGHLDDDGFLFITGRKKELIVTSAGKNVAPSVLEDGVRAHPLVSQCIVVGDNRPYVAALVTIDAETFADWKSNAGLPAETPVTELREHQQLVQEIQSAIDQANKLVSNAEAIKRFRILPTDFTEAGGEMTPTLKLKRNVITKEYGEEIEALYS
jgi:long-chain acyl-CoA synthetase